MHDALNTFIKETFEIPLSMFHFLLRRRPCLFLNPIETLSVECSMYHAECNICLVKCSIYPVESNIDFGHLKFPLGLILRTILTPKVEKCSAGRD